MHLFASSCLAVIFVTVVSCSGGGNKPDDGDGGAGGDQAGGDGGGSDEGGTTGGGGSVGSGGKETGTGGGTVGGTGGTPSATGGSGSGGMNSAGVSGTAGKPGAGGTPGTGGTPSGVLSPECSKLANCDGFESYTTASQPGGPWTGFEVDGGTLAVDQTRGFKGSSKSIKITVSPGTKMLARMRHSGAGLLPSDAIYMRMMVWMDAAPKGPAGHWNWMWAQGDAVAKSGGKLLGDTFVASGGDLKSGSTWMLHGAGASGGFQDCFAAAQTKFPVGRWACYEFHLDGKTNSGEAWVDGKLDEVLSFEDKQPLSGQCVVGNNYTNGLWYVPKIEKAFFGFKMYHTLGGTATAWLDDIAISTTRIGCPAP